MSHINKVKSRMFQIEQHIYSQICLCGEEYEESLEYALSFLELVFLGAWLDFVLLFAKE